jgi:hypothetical protein
VGRRYGDNLLPFPARSIATNMNLHRHEKAETKGQAWYLQPETTQNVHKSPVPAQETQPAPSTTPSLFEPSEAERILARAGVLQEIHDQLLSSEQIEAIADEIGIKPEFVHLAIEQEKVIKPLTSGLIKNNSRKSLTIAAILLPCYTLSASVLCVTAHRYDHGSIGFFHYAFIVPALLALGLGIVGLNRRWGTASGAAFSTIYTAVMIIGSMAYGERSPVIGDLPFFATLIGSGALLGLIGAQARRIVSRRQASNRSRRTITAERAQ